MPRCTALREAQVAHLRRAIRRSLQEAQGVARCVVRQLLLNIVKFPFVGERVEFPSKLLVEPAREVREVREFTKFANAKSNMRADVGGYLQIFADIREYEGGCGRMWEDVGGCRRIFTNIGQGEYLLI